MKAVLAVIKIILLSGSAMAQSTDKNTEETTIGIDGIEQAVRYRTSNVTRDNLGLEIKTATVQETPELQSSREDRGLSAEMDHHVEQQLGKSLNWWTDASYLVWRGGW